MSIRPTQPQSIGGVLDISFQLYKASIGSVWPISLLMIFASSPPTLYMIMRGGVVAADPTNPFAAFAVMSRPGYWLAYLLSMLMISCVIGAMYFKEHAIAVGEDMSIGGALQASLGKVVPLLFTTILYGIAVGVGMVLLLIPGFILAISLLTSFCMVLFEDKGPLAALSGSHKLVWGDWWRTSVILTVGFIVVIVAYFAVFALVGVIAPLVGLGVQDVFFYSLVTGFVVGGIINLLLAPYYIALTLSIYWDLKLRKEGGDLAARVGALGTT
jgi:hypothetical protein